MWCKVSIDKVWYMWYTLIMNKTLYVKEADVSIWERAEKLAPEGVSPLVTALLRDFVAKNEVSENGFERITIESRGKKGGPAVRKSFVGRWLVPPGTNLFAEQDDSGLHWNSRVSYAVAQTKAGRLAVYEYEPKNEAATTCFAVYNSFEEFRNSRIQNCHPRYPQNVIAVVAEAIGRPYTIELDI